MQFVLEKLAGSQTLNNLTFACFIEVSLRERCGLTVIRWLNHQQNDSWWQILWTKLDLLVDPSEHLQLEDALPECDD